MKPHVDQSFGLSDLRRSTSDHDGQTLVLSLTHFNRTSCLLHDLPDNAGLGALGTKQGRFTGVATLLKGNMEHLQQHKQDSSIQVRGRHQALCDASAHSYADTPLSSTTHSETKPRAQHTKSDEMYPH